MHIRMLEKVIHGGQVFHRGAELGDDVPDEYCEYFVDRGWAEDVTPDVAADQRRPTGQRDTTKRVLTPDAVVNRMRSSGQ